LTTPVYINDRGEIAGIGVLANGDTHAYVLIPCGQGEESCGDSFASAAAQSSPALVTQPRTIAAPAYPVLGGRGILNPLCWRWFPGRRAFVPASGPTR